MIFYRIKNAHLDRKFCIRPVWHSNFQFSVHLVIYRMDMTYNKHFRKSRWVFWLDLIGAFLEHDAQLFLFSLFDAITEFQRDQGHQSFHRRQLLLSLLLAQVFGGGLDESVGQLCHVFLLDSHGIMNAADLLDQMTMRLTRQHRRNHCRNEKCRYERGKEADGL